MALQQHDNPTFSRTARNAQQLNQQALSGFSLEQQRRQLAADLAARQQAVDEKYGELTGGGKVASDVIANAIPMLPAMGVGLLTGGVGSIPAFFLYGRGQGEAQALNQGATMDEANRYGLATGLLETGTEALVGGIPGTKGLINPEKIVASKLGQQLFQNGLSRKAAREGIDIIGEGVEEVIAEGVDPYLQRRHL